MRLLLIALALFAHSNAQAALTLYTDRPTARVQPIAESFKQKTGVEVLVVEMSYPAILKKLEEEKNTHKADLVLTKDLAYLGELQEKGHLQKLPSNTAVPAFMQSQEWTAVSFRARTFVYSPERVKKEELSQYADLADARWAGRLCLRTGKHPYNEALAASLLEKMGEEKTQKLFQDMKENLARPFFNGDTALIEAIAKGECDVGLVNHYYYAQLLALNSKLPVAISFADQGKGGVHVNGTGIAILKNSEQVKLAQDFVEHMLSDQVQLDFSAAHFDYPAKTSLVPSSLIKDFGSFEKDSTAWSKLYQNLKTAKKILSTIE